MQSALNSLDAVAATVESSSFDLFLLRLFAFLQNLATCTLPPQPKQIITLHYYYYSSFILLSS